jgi:hypothetical protein
MRTLTRRQLLETLGSTVGSALVLDALPFPEKASVPVLRVKEELDAVEIDNGLVRARFRKLPHGIEQEYSALDADGRWTTVARSLHPGRPRPSGCAPLYADQNVAGAYRLLAADGLRSVHIAQKADGHVQVELRGELEGNEIEQSVLLERGENYLHIEVRAVLAADPPRLEYLLSTFCFVGGASPDFTHVPCLKRASDDVIGDRIFDAPAVILQKGGGLAALLPDLDLLNQEVVYAKGARPVDGIRGFQVPQDPDHISFPAIMDLDLKSGLTPDPIFAFGLADFITEQHVFWRHENKQGAMVRELARNQLRYGFDLFLRADAPANRGYQQVSKYLWERYGAHYFEQPRPQAMPFSEYARVCFPAAFAYKGDMAQDAKRYSEQQPYDPANSGPLESWLEFDLDGRPCGGIRATPAQWYYDIQFSPWWNNVRDAMGMYWWGMRGDASLVAKARRIVNLSLAAPQHEGIFPSIYNYRDKRWVGCYWKPAEDFNAHWTFPSTWDPKRIPTNFWNSRSDYYQTSAASKTGVYLLRFRRLCEDEPRILPFLQAYGDFLLAHVDSNGSLPAWFNKDLEPVRQLRFNGEGGIHIWFLIELYAATQEKKYLETSKRLADFMNREILPSRRWYDFETFYSCSIKPENFLDEFTGQWPQCTLSMLWAIDGFASLHQATGNTDYLSAAEAVADYAGFFQAVWQPHFIITAYAFGGFRSQNSDAEWLDMRQSLFGESFARLGLMTGRQDLLERGVAALRSSLAIINHPRLIQNDIFRYPRYPLGIEPENIDHEGLPQDPLRSGFDWGEGGALASAAGLMQQLGGAFIDFKRSIGVGVDGVYVKSFTHEGRQVRLNLHNQLAALPFPYSDPYRLELRIQGLPAGTYQLVVNGGAAVSIELPAPKGIQLKMGPNGIR